jgi:hypothetical protein
VTDPNTTALQPPSYSAAAAAVCSGGDTLSADTAAADNDDDYAAASASAPTGAVGAAGAAGMHCLLRGRWVQAKVSDFGLSLCVSPNETHVSSVHAVRANVCERVLINRVRGFSQP